MILSQPDQELFGKYYGDFDLINNDKFWEDVQVVYKDKNIILPLVVNPKTIRIYNDYFKCEEGCGGCCDRNWYTKVTTHDYERMKRYLSPDIMAVLDNHLDKDKDGHVSIKGPCPFLIDKKCSVHHCRPDACYFFPIQVDFHVNSDIDGKKMEQMVVRIQCKPSVDAVRSIFRELINKSEDKLLLLPNLNLVNRKVGG